MSKSEEDKQPDDANGIVYRVLAATFNFLRPYTPQLIPILVCSLFIPIILAVSGFAGYVVWSSLSAAWEVPIYLQYGDGVAPYARTTISAVHPSQRYDISLRLSVPHSDSNLALGNFMATLVLSTPTNQTLATVRRSAVAVAPDSWWPFGSPRLIKLQISMLDSFIPGSHNLLAHIEVGRKDNWTPFGGVTRELSVESASLHGLVVPHGVRGIAIRFPLLSSLAAAFIFLCITSTILGLCVLPLMIPNEIQEEETASVNQDSTHQKPSSERSRRKVRSLIRRLSEGSSSSSSPSIKTEVEVTAMPPAEEKHVPESLRQRRVSTKEEPEGE